MVPARLTIIMGKGGVGRTTVACAFALDRARAGERVLLVSVAANDDPTARIAHEAAGLQTHDRLHLLSIDSRQLVDDLVRRITRLGAWADFILGHPSYESLIDIVPGVREMAIFHLLERKRHQGFDRIVLDAPATGHGIHFLEAPDKAAKILAGPLRERALELKAMLHDGAQTDVVIVTLPEETPVRETLDLSRQLGEQAVPLDNIVVNKWLPRVFVDAPPRAVLARFVDDARARATFAASLEGRLATTGPEAFDAEAWTNALALVAGQRAEAAEHLASLRALEVKLAIVPHIPDSANRLMAVADAMQRPLREVDA